MNGFDWNNNGSHDQFDSFMDYKVSNESGGNGSSPSSGGGGGLSKGHWILIGIAVIGFICKIGSCAAG